MQISQSLSGKQGVATAQLLSQDLSRRLYTEGTLCKKKGADFKKSGEHYFLFSDMLVVAGTKEKKGKVTYEISKLIKAEELARATILSSQYAADESDRAMFQLGGVDLPALYAETAAAATAWVGALKKVLMGLLQDDPGKSGPGGHHALCSGTIFAAALAGDAASVQRAVQLDRACATAVDEYGATALMLAAKAGHASLVLALTSAGADVNAADENGRTAGHYAAGAGCAEALDMLGAYQFNFNAADKVRQRHGGLLQPARGVLTRPISGLVRSETPLTWFPARFACVLDHTQDDVVPLATLVETGAMAAAQIAVQKGAVVDRISRTGRTGLHVAIANGDTESMGRWLRLGASADKPVVDRARHT
eukprot:SAG22_NODE_1564_length_4112_cov_2.178420_2_plen_365_part_00